MNFRNHNYPNPSTESEDGFAPSRPEPDFTSSLLVEPEVEEPAEVYDIDFDDPVILNQIVKMMVEMTPAAYVVLDRDFRTHYANDYFLKLRRLTAAEVAGAFCYDMSNNGRPCPVCAVRDTFATGRKSSIMRRDLLPDGSIRHIEDQAIPIYRTEAGDFDYVLELMIDRSRVMQLREEAAGIFLDIVQRLISVLEKKDPYTSTHSTDVSAISSKLARYLGLGEEEVFNITLGALLHDIGKVLIPDLIINKPDHLNSEEYERIKRHPEESFNLLADLEGFAFIKDICLRHHEWWNGGGYPGGLRGEENPRGAHIVSLADAYDAMTSDRSYRQGLSHREALAEIERGLGTQFHPEIGRRFLELATRIFPGREELIARDPSPLRNMFFNRPREGVERVLKSAGCPGLPPMSLAGYQFNQKHFQHILENTPALVTVISENFDLLFASDSTALALGGQASDMVGRKCYEVNQRNTSCLMDGEDLACPGLRALASGQPQVGEVEESWGESAMNFDIYAAPIELVDRQGQTVRCILEILFDRTSEVGYQRQLVRDLTGLIRTLEKLISRIDPLDTGNSEAIIRECDSLGEFLHRFSREVARRYGQAMVD